MGESERKGKEAGELKASCQKETFINGKDDLTVLGLGAFIANPSYKIPKKPKAKAITRDKTGRKLKRRNKSQKNQKSGKVNSGMR